MKIYHKDIYMPKFIRHWPKSRFTNLLWTKHSHYKASLLKIPKFDEVIFDGFNIVEAEVNNKFVTKLVLRIPYTKKQDLCVVLRPSISEEGSYVNIITLWLNDVDDEHKTLDDSRYDKE